MKVSSLKVTSTSVLAAGLFIVQLSAAFSEPFNVELFSKTITRFQHGNDQNTFGKLKFIGGIEFTSSNSHVGAISGMVLIKERSQILAVTDTGYWFTAKIKRSSNGTPIALHNGRMAPLLDKTGKPYQFKGNSDAESIVIDGQSALVSFERDDRVLRYKLDLENFSSIPKRVKLNLDVTKLRTNKGLETILLAPANGPLKGAPIIITERSFAKKKRIKAAIISGPGKGLFTVKRKGKFDITDGGFLPNGDLILLERRFNLANGLGIRLRRIKAGKVKPGANLKGKTLLKADGSYQIDNMEGLSITTDNKGHIYLSLISDNNHSMLQRNLYLEFRLVENQ